MTIDRYFHYEPYMDFYRTKHFGKEFIILDNQGKRTEENGGVHATWGLVVTRSDQMREVFIKSQINAEVGGEFVGYDFTETDEWACKNPPEYILVRKLKNLE